MSIFDEVLRKRPETPDGNIFGGSFGGPTMDRTATSDWRSSDVAPIALKLRHKQDIADTMGQPATTSLDSSHFENQSGIGSAVGGIFKGLLRGVVGGAQSALESVPDVHEIQTDFGSAFPKAIAAPFSVPINAGLGFLGPRGIGLLDQGGVDTAVGGLGMLVPDARVARSGGPLARGAEAADIARAAEVRPAPRALPAPARQLALPARIDNVSEGFPPGGIPNRPSVIDTTARPSPTFEQQIRDSLARQRENPTPTAELANRHPISANDPGTVAPITLEDLNRRTGAKAPTEAVQSFGQRVGKLTPVGREDLTLGKRVAKPSDVPPISIDELRQRIGVDPSYEPPVRLDAEQLSARIGSKTRAQAENSAVNSMNVEQRQAATGTLGQSGMSGPLVGRAIGRGNSQLARSGLKSEGLTASPNDLNASLVRQAKVHDANEAAIAAAKAGDRAAYDRAIENVKLLGGDVKHTEARVRAAGATRTTTDATVMDDMAASIEALKKKAPPGGKALMADTEAGPQSPASSLSERPTLIGMSEIRPSTIGLNELPADLYKRYISATPDARSSDISIGQFGGKPARIRVVSEIPTQPDALGMTLNRLDDGPVILVRADLLPKQFETVVRHELEHAGQSPKMDLVSAERRAYASHGAAPSESADRYAKNSEGWWADGGRNSAGDIAGDTVRGLGQRFLRMDRVPDRTLAGSSPNGKSKLPDGPPTGLGGDMLRPKVSRGVEQVSGTGKTLTTAMSPFHFMFRHALPFMAAHPQAWLKGSVKGLGEGFKMNPAQLDARIQTMRDNLTRNGLGKVYLGKPHLGAVGGEESVASGWLTKLGPLGKVIQRSGQGFTQGLNEVRYEAAKGAVNSSEWMAQHGLAQKMTMADREAIADSINHFSGRGIDTTNMGDTGKAAMRLMNVPMFSPQLATARVRMLGDFAGALKTVTKDLATGKAPRAADIEKARLGVGYLTGVGSMYLLMTAAGGKVDTNLLSSSSGQVAFGQPDEHGPLQAAVGVAAPEVGMGTNEFDGQPMRIDPTASEATLIRHIARFATAIYDRASGQQNLKAGTGNQQEQTPFDVAANAVVGTIFTSPIGYPIAEWLRGYPVEPLDSILPMPVTGGLKGAGVKMPEIGAKEKTTTGSKTPRSGPVPTKAPRR